MTERPTRHRLIVAMGVATGFLALLLVLLDVFLPIDPSLRNAREIRDHVLQVLIKRHELPAPANPEATRPQTPPTLRAEERVIEEAADDRSAESRAPGEVPAGPRSPIDWNAEIVESVAALHSQRQANKAVRQSMWRQSHSVMFRPEDEFVPSTEEPVLADLRFKPEVNVAGLGLKIGSCFVGLPLIGVPVEQRSVAVRLFVCADGSG